MTTLERARERVGTTPVTLPVDLSAELRRSFRRGRLAWLVSAAGILVLALAFVANTLGRGPGGAVVVPRGSDAVVVLDVSGSAGAYTPQIERALAAVVRTSKHAGLIVFSDSAYEALPPSTPGSGLRAWLDAFRHDQPDREPWKVAGLSAGTAIGPALDLARAALLRDHVAHPHVVLVSDMSDAGYDADHLNASIATLEREGIDLRIVLLAKVKGAQSADLAASLTQATVLRGAATRIIDVSALAPLRSTDAKRLLLVELAIVLAAALALYQLVFRPFAWRPAT